MADEQKLATTARGIAAPGTPTLILMHFLGGSGREWDEVVPLLSAGLRTVTIDLPGFGGSAGVPGYTVAEMADRVAATVDELALERYVLVGHSMSGKVAAVLARRAQDASGDASSRLAALILVAPSPPGPEPMSDDKRANMIAALGQARSADPETDRQRARSYITKNEARDIPVAVEQRASAEVLRMNRAAWVAWVEQGSREDWAARVGTLDVPTLVVTGDKDTSLGPDFQRTLTLPHLANGRMEVLRGCSHLIPMERPSELAELIERFLASLATESLGWVTVPQAYAAFLEGDRVSFPTRRVIERRLRGPEPADVFSSEQRMTLRAVVARVIPQNDQAIDLAGTIEAQLATGVGDGWRYDNLPPDLEAYRQALDRLAGQSFRSLSVQAQDAALHGLNETPGSPQARWFEELRGDAVTAYMSHPRTLARVGYSGFGVGGASTPQQGFVSLGPDEREAWEPLPEAKPTRGEVFGGLDEKLSA